MLGTRSSSRIVALAAAGSTVVSCGGARPPVEPVTSADAHLALDEVRTVAAARTPEAMAEVCALAVRACDGFSGAIVAHPGSAPGTDVSPPEVLCEGDAGSGAWELVVEGVDGYGRPYVSQFVVYRDDEGRPAPLREPAFWLGTVYRTAQVTGATSWTTAWHPHRRER